MSEIISSHPYEASNSEIKTFRQCRRKWWLTYILRLRSRSASMTGPLPLGSRIHKSLEMYYRDGSDPIAVHNELVSDATMTLMMEGGDLKKLEGEAELGRLMLEGYLQWVAEEGVDADLEVIGVEEVLKYPMLGGDVTLIGKLDLRVRNVRTDTKFVLDLKHLDVHEPVLTPTGWVEIGNLQPGDRVIGSDWRPTTVLGLSGRVMQPTYRIEFTDHTFSYASGEHAWPTHAARQSAPRKFRTTEQIKEYVERDGQRDLYITGIEPGPGGDDPDVDPYLLGCWIANGSTRPDLGSTRIHDGITESAVLTEAGLTFRTYSSRPTVAVAAGPKELNSYLRAAGLLGKRSAERWLPWDALMASTEFRTRLLGGLMDGDGSMSGATSTRYYTSSAQLAEDVALLVRSLGGHAVVYKKRSPRYTYRGSVRYGQDAYDVNIRGDWNPFIAHEKNRERWESIESQRKVSRQHTLKKVKSVTYVGERECVCIAVSAADHLFVTRGGALTKNTAASFDEFDKTSQMNPQLKTYQLLDALNHPEEERIEGGIFRLLKKVKRTDRATPPFYRDVVVRHNKYALRSFWVQLNGVLRDMVSTRSAILNGGDPMELAYPNPTRECTWHCPFVAVCPMFDDGSDAETMLNDLFEESNPYDYYGSDGGSEAAKDSM